jgi:uncharacterized protein (TIGR02271 family)
MQKGVGMNPSAAVRVTDPQGVHGIIDTAAWPMDGRRAEVLVSLDSGQQVLVPLELLVRQGDGSYRLTVAPASWERQRGAGADAREPPLVLPAIEETLTVETRPVETGRIRIRKVVREREEVVDPPLLRDEVRVERVPVNRLVDGITPARSEGDTLIIPLFEEVVVVEKRLLLKEELRITKHRTETHTPQRVTLRREEAVVERANRGGYESNSST